MRKYDIDIPPIEGESVNARRALEDYCWMGWRGEKSRSLQNLVALYENELASKAPPTKRLRTLKEWSRKFHWTTRAQEFDNKILETLRRENLRLLLREYRKTAAGYAKIEEELFAGARIAMDRGCLPEWVKKPGLLKALELSTKGKSGALERLSQLGPLDVYSGNIPAWHSGPEQRRIEDQPNGKVITDSHLASLYEALDSLKEQGAFESETVDEEIEDASFEILSLPE